ncbi:MAG: DUF3368 domain-containing protein [Bryobacteraceae bacterium]
MSTIILAQEIKADLVLLDDSRARTLAQEEGLSVTGCVGVLDSAYRRGLLTSLHEAYHQLLAAGAYVDREMLEESLRKFKLPPL